MDGEGLCSGTQNVRALPAGIVHVHCADAMVAPVVCRTVLMCDTDGNRLRRYHLQRVNDMVLSADGRTLVTVAQEKKIKLLRLHENREVCARHQLCCCAEMCGCHLSRSPACILRYGGAAHSLHADEL